MVASAAAWGSPTHRCNPHTHSQGVGVNKGYGLLGWARREVRICMDDVYKMEWVGKKEKMTNKVQMPVFLVFTA